MDVLKVLGDLRAYKVELDRAIAIFDRLAHNRGKRGRPVLVPSARRRMVSAEARERMAAAQRKRWAAARKGAAKPKT
jgi:hypothetical protein